MSSKNGYERQDINPYKVIGVSAAGIVILVFILILLTDYFIIEKEDMVYNTNLKNISVDLKDLQTSESATLNNYKLLDAEKGVYQIPIDRAMQLIAEESFKQRLNTLKKSR